MRRFALPLMLAGCTAASGTPTAAPSALDGRDLTSAFGGSVPPACAGPRIALAALSACQCARSRPPSASSPRHVQAGAWCGERFDGPVGSHVRVDVHASTTDVAASEAIDLTLRLRGASDAPTPLRFSGADAVRSVQVFDARGVDVTTSGACGHGSSGPGSEHLVLLDAGGEATRTLRWEPTHLHGEQRGEACTETRRAYAPGTYRLVLHTALEGPPDVTAPSIIVRVR